jgi:uncharacterized protein with NAD-binding domain and iron-sulfur cluster
MEPFPVVIIGGGLAGLTAAVHLAERGVAPLVLEASSAWPGGRLCGGDDDSFEYGGRMWSFAPDHGVHAVWGGYVNMQAMLDRFVQTPLQDSDGEEWIHRVGREVRTVEAGSAVRSRWLPAPFHYLQLLFRPRFWRTIRPHDFLSLPGFLISLLWTTGFDPLKEGARLEGLTMREFFAGWTPNLRATFTGLGVNLLAAPADRISLSAFIAAIRFYTMMNRDLWRVRFWRGESHTQLITPLVQAITARGGAVQLGATALSVERCGDLWHVRVEDDGRRGTRTVIARRVILALSAPAAKRLLLAGDSTRAAADGLRFPAALRTAAIRLWFSAQPRDGASSGMFTGDFEVHNFFWLHRLYDAFAEWLAAGGSALEVHAYGSERFMDQPDRNLLILAVNEVYRAFPELNGKFVYGVVRRNSRTHTEFVVPGHDSLLVETPWPDVYACGDWIGLAGTPSLWMERAVTTGIAAANRVLIASGVEPWRLAEPVGPGPLALGIGGIVRAARWLFTPVYRLLRSIRWRLKRR